MISEAPDVKPRTRAQQRADTRAAILDSTGECLTDGGYAALTTRRVAERAGVAQSTVMHHFATRDALLVEAVAHLAVRVAEDALEQIDLSGLRSRRHREAVLDQAWREFTRPRALAVFQLWIAAWHEPELGPALRDLEDRLGEIIVAAAGRLFPEAAGDARFPALIDAAVVLIRGLLVGLPVSGAKRARERWEELKPVLLAAATELLDG